MCFGRDPEKKPATRGRAKSKGKGGTRGDSNDSKQGKGRGKRADSPAPGKSPFGDPDGPVRRWWLKHSCLRADPAPTGTRNHALSTKAGSAMLEANVRFSIRKVWLLLLPTELLTTVVPQTPLLQKQGKQKRSRTPKRRRKPKSSQNRHSVFSRARRRGLSDASIHSGFSHIAGGNSVRPFGQLLQSPQHCVAQQCAV